MVEERGSSAADSRANAHAGSRRAQAPPIAISPISSAGVATEPPNGTQRASEPVARTAASIEDRSEAIVNSSAGSASSPPEIARPVAPTENVPETGLTPE